MIAPDSSVLIAGADDEHRFFEAAAIGLAEVRQRGCLIGHTMAETQAVLTSPAFAWHPAAVGGYLRQFLKREPIGLDPSEYPSALETLAASGTSGGAVYDGLIALGAKRADAVLLSFDRRAVGTYERCGVDFELLPQD